MSKFAILILFMSSVSFGKFPIMVLDSGVETKHQLLKKHILIIEAEKQNLVEGDFDGIEDRTQDSHGTHVAGIIVKSFPEVMIVPVKNLPGPTAPLASIRDTVNKRFNLAIQFAILHQIKIVNFSQVMGYLDESNLEIIKKAAEANILIVVASGNAGADITERERRLIKNHKKLGMEDDALMSYPCMFRQPNVVCVGNYDKTGTKREAVSNFGEDVVDVFAYGQEIKSSCTANSYCEKSGSSMSAPRISAELGKIWNKHPSWNYQAVKDALLKKLPVSSDLKKQSKTGAYLD